MKVFMVLVLANLCISNLYAKNLVKCSATEILNEDFFEGSFNVEQYPEFSLSENNNELFVKIGANSFSLNNGDYIEYTTAMGKSVTQINIVTPQNSAYSFSAPLTNSNNEAELFGIMPFEKGGKYRKRTLVAKLECKNL